MKNQRAPAHKHHAYGLKGRSSKKDPFESLPANPTLSDIKSAVADASMEELEDRINDVRESWETESLFEDVIDELENQHGKPADTGKFCSVLDSAALVSCLITTRFSLVCVC